MRVQEKNNEMIFKTKEGDIPANAVQAVNSIHHIYANLLVNSETLQKQINAVPKQKLSAVQMDTLTDLENQIQDNADHFSGYLDDILLFIQDWGSKNNKQLEDKNDLFIDLSNIHSDVFEINNEILNFHKDYCKAEEKNQLSIFPPLMRSHKTALSKHISFLILRAKSISWSMKRVFPEYSYKF